jgi:hypothetical protein
VIAWDSVRGATARPEGRVLGVRPGTLADRRAYLEGGLTEIACDRCAARVRVRKTSPAQTSVQWTVRAVDQCDELADQSALVRTCGALRDSIERAVREGRLDTDSGAGS